VFADPRFPLPASAIPSGSNDGSSATRPPRKTVASEMMS